MNIGERIKAYREACDLYQSDLARKIGVTRQAISSWEIGRTLPNIGAIERMSQVFGCTKTDLIGDSFTQQDMANNDMEIELLKGFRDADEETKRMVMRLLSYQKKFQELMNNESNKTK